MSSPTVPWVTVEMVQRHLRLPVSAGSPSTDAELDLEDKIRQARDMLWQYLERQNDADWMTEMESWTVGTLPGAVEAAMLVLIGELYRFRGDDPEQPDREPGYLSPSVRAYLARYRDPVVS